jgi:heme-degrading monooxygenase HmoA
MRIGTHPWYTVTNIPTQPDAVSAAADAADSWADDLHARRRGCRAAAVHRARDGLRVVVVTAWDSPPAGHEHHDADATTDVLTVAHSSAPEGITVGAPGVATVIDVLPVPRPLLRPAVRFTVSNGRAFARRPGFGAAVVLRGTGRRGAIATYAHWHDEDAFLTAFTARGGTAVATTAQVNDAAARRTRGFIRTDYHTHDVVHVVGS